MLSIKKPIIPLVLKITDCTSNTLNLIKSNFSGAGS